MKLTITEAKIKLKEESLQNSIFDKIRNNQNFILNSLSDYENYKYINENFKNSLDFNIKAIKKNPYTYMFMKKEYQNNEQIALIALKRDVCLIKNTELINNKEFMKKALKLDNLCFDIASENLKKDRIYILDILKLSEFIINNVSNELKNDKKLIIEAVKNSGWSFKYASEELRNDKGFIYLLLKKNNKDFFTHASKEIKEWCNNNENLFIKKYESIKLNEKIINKINTNINLEIKEDINKKIKI